MTTPDGASGEPYAALLEGELRRLSEEIAAYPDEASLWRPVGAQPNPGGTLALHTVGHLMHYVGEGLGRIGYRRDREAEFTDRVDRDEILGRVRRCASVIGPVLRGLDGAALAAVYPGAPPERMAGIETRGFLLYVIWHTGWHRGQVRYHRLSL